MSASGRGDVDPRVLSPVSDPAGHRAPRRTGHEGESVTITKQVPTKLTATKFSMFATVVCAQQPTGRLPGLVDVTWEDQEGGEARYAASLLVIPTAGARVRLRLNPGEEIIGKSSLRQRLHPLWPAHCAFDWIDLEHGGAYWEPTYQPWRRGIELVCTELGLAFLLGSDHPVVVAGAVAGDPR